MNCKKVLSRLDAYLDGEMPAQLIKEMGEHFDACRSCRSQLERIRQVGYALDSLKVPAVPSEFAARVMARASVQEPFAREKKCFSPLEWRPLRWILDLSVPVRAAACTALALACFLGILMSREISLSESCQSRVSGQASLDGFEWFNPTPPESLGSAYLTLAEATPDDPGRK